MGESRRGQRISRYWPWGVSWGMAWATLLCLSSGSALLVRLESDLQQWLFRWRGPQEIAEEVVILGIDGQVEGDPSGQELDFRLERANYAALTLRLLEQAGAAVVVLNLPSSFLVPQTLGGDDLDAPLRQVVQRYSDQLVLASRSSESFQRAEISIYNHFLPFSSLLLENVVPPDNVQGVVQYQTDPLGILRQAQLWGEFKRRDSQTSQVFAFVEALTMVKLDREKASLLFKKEPQIDFNPLNPGQSIEQIPIERVCPPRTHNPCLGEVDPEQLVPLRNKVVLVGFVDGNPEIFPVRLPTGEQISAVALQGQILSSMILGQFYYSLPMPLVILLVELVGIGTGLYLVRRTQVQSWRWMMITLGGGLLLYGGWAVAQLLLWRWVWPLTLPVLTCSLTAISVYLTLVLLHNRDRLMAQQVELERLRREEQEAAVDQARKLLYRVATDIHDQELQELKLVMDTVETLQWQQQESIPLDPGSYDRVLVQLEHIGQGIRNQLNDVRVLASKLELSPGLREGLHQGIATYLDHLIASGTLTLPVQRQLQPLQELNTSEWLDQREDVLRFFREAMTNVIGHVQPPKGTATFVEVSLTQSDGHCRLTVINDGYEHQPKHGGGYGTKAMNTIAQYLPQGSWHRRRTSEGWTHVELVWEMPTPGLES